MFGRMLQNSGALLPNEVFDLTDELFFAIASEQM